MSEWGDLFAALDTPAEPAKPAPIETMMPRLRMCRCTHPRKDHTAANDKLTDGSQRMYCGNGLCDCTSYQEKL